MEILDGKLPVMVFPVHLQRSAVVAIRDCPDRGQFIGPRSLKQAALQWIWHFQETLIRTRLEGYAKSINARRGIEKIFGWIKQFGVLRQFKLRGRDNVSAVFGLHVIAYNLIRLGNILKPVMDAP